MTSTAEQMRAHRGAPLWLIGLRPFFLGAAIWAVLCLAIWLPMLAGSLSLPTAFAPLEWHTHELVYGYVPAVIAGFLLTAVPNWTGRLPVTGRRLQVLFATWVAGRFAVSVSSLIGAGPAALIDIAFLAALAAVIGREIWAADNRRNLKVLVAIAILLAGNVTLHVEATRGGIDYGPRVGIAAAIGLIMLIGGRIIPSFTRNWLARRAPGRLPVPFDRFDVAVVIVSAMALAAWVAAPRHGAVAVLATVAAALNVARLARWAGERTWSEPLVFVLHAGFAFVPIGFLLVGLGIWRPDVLAPSGALHGWTTGAIGTMTLAVMTRASLGHTGQDLRATRSIQLIYIAAIAAAAARILAGFGLWREPMLYASVAAWIAAFGGFVAVYWPFLTKARA